MKKLLALLLFLPVFLHAQDNDASGPSMIPDLARADDSASTDSTKIWAKGGAFALNFTQASYTNWAAGGINSISGQVLFGVFANYKKGLNTWDNSLDLGYGLLQQSTSAYVKKTDDKIDFTSKYGRYAFKKVWFYSALFGFKTQFQPGYNYLDDTAKTKISDFMSPGYALLAIGLDYKPNKKFSLLISPLTAKFTFVNDQALADAGAYGVKKAVYDTAGNIITPGQNVRGEFGSYLRAQYNTDVMKNVTLAARLELFSNYLHNPQNIDVNADLLLGLKVNKYITASLNFSAIYDDDVMIAVDNNHDGVIDGVGPRLQFRQVMAVGFSAKF
ncbi:MAG TPA: DUF3078 domain-containing protein [Bacteroidia bacterium]|jgi:hypothetical protein|nr:DUF3078 domain-containing protein [Bacteroidia bacterium]